MRGSLQEELKSRMDDVLAGVQQERERVVALAMQSGIVRREAPHLMRGGLMRGGMMRGGMMRAPRLMPATLLAAHHRIRVCV